MNEIGNTGPVVNDKGSHQAKQRAEDRVKFLQKQEHRAGGCGPGGKVPLRDGDDTGLGGSHEDTVEQRIWCQVSKTVRTHNLPNVSGHQ